MDSVRIFGLELACIIGIRPSERVREQLVRLDIVLHADTRQAGRSGRIAATTDYADVAAEVSALVRFRRYHLLEMAAEELAAMLLGIHPNVRSLELCIEKPLALAGSARAAAVEIERSREDFPALVERLPFGERHVLLETRDAELDLLHIAPGATASAGPGFEAEALRWLVQGTLRDDEQLLPVGLVEPPVVSGSQNYFNPGPEASVLFRCWRSRTAAAR